MIVHVQAALPLPTAGRYKMTPTKMKGKMMDYDESSETMELEDMEEEGTGLSDPRLHETSNVVSELVRMESIFANSVKVSLGVLANMGFDQAVAYPALKT